MLHSQTLPSWPGRGSGRTMLVFSVPNNWTEVCSLVEVAATITVSPARGLGGATLSFSSPWHWDGFATTGELLVPGPPGAGASPGPGVPITSGRVGKPAGRCVGKARP